jgi:four helix bundle protein
MAQIRSAKDLIVYQKAYALATQVYDISKSFPRDERYSLTDQIRRASRSVCTNLKEAWAKRRYEAHFVSKLSDSDGENSEVETWLDFAKHCGHMSEKKHLELTAQVTEVGKMLGSMMRNPGPFLLTSER